MMHCHVLLGITAICLAIALFALSYAMAGAPSGDPTRLGLRGMKRRRALAENRAWAAIEPAARWVGRRVRGLVSDRLVASLDLQITRAGDFLGLVPEELLGFSALTGVLGAAVGLIVARLTHGGQLIVMLIAGFGAVAPFMVVSSSTTERYQAVARRLPGVIDLLALGVGAGLDFPSAVRQIVEKAGNASDPLIEELSLILQSLKLGRTRQAALEGFAERVPCRAVLDFAGAVVQAELRGTPVANVLALQAETARLQRTVNAEVAASKASVKLIIPLALIFLCVLLLIVAPMVIRLRR
ncbi:MAG TPA: type II secretion system F family protein [Polyangiaceae bacterium]|nr:type II secretion system F family protein [Polyangiaceae bacterium]